VTAVEAVEVHIIHGDGVGLVQEDTQAAVVAIVMFVVVVS
jgi:hypothetical protein